MPGWYKKAFTYHFLLLSLVTSLINSLKAQAKEAHTIKPGGSHCRIVWGTETVQEEAIKTRVWVFQTKGTFCTSMLPAPSSSDCRAGEQQVEVYTISKRTKLNTVWYMSAGTLMYPEVQVVVNSAPMGVKGEWSASHSHSKLGTNWCTLGRYPIYHYHQSGVIKTLRTLLRQVRELGSQAQHPQRAPSWTLFWDHQQEHGKEQKPESPVMSTAEGNKVKARTNSSCITSLFQPPSKPRISLVILFFKRYLADWKQDVQAIPLDTESRACLKYSLNKTSIEITASLPVDGQEIKS